MNPTIQVIYEPWNGERHSVFYHFTGKENGITMREIAHLCKAHFTWDLVIGNEYTCKLFKESIGDYIRFNITNGREIALFYENNHPTEAQEVDRYVEKLQHYLQTHYCTTLG